MKFTLLIASALLATAAFAQSLPNCGPGTGDPQCTAHNRQREAMEAEKNKPKPVSNAGAYGEKPTPSSATNDSGRTGGKTVSR
jgi:hypothetical protein